MATLISAHNSEGCYGRCDAKCYNATTPNCTCICGGANHGAGFQQAAENTHDLMEIWIEDWERNHPGHEWEFRVPDVQLSMFEEA